MAGAGGATLPPPEGSRGVRLVTHPSPFQEPPASEMRMSLYHGMIRVALRRPGVWPALVGLAWASRGRGWWRRVPFLPLPPPEYLAWRSETAWGEEAGGSDEAVVRYLHWTREMRRRSRRPS
jgi:hypothetical protein